jgi:hypothetical protein
MLEAHLMYTKVLPRHRRQSVNLYSFNRSEPSFTAHITTDLICLARPTIMRSTGPNRRREQITWIQLRITLAGKLAVVQARTPIVRTQANTSICIRRRATNTIKTCTLQINSNTSNDLTKQRSSIHSMMCSMDLGRTLGRYMYLKRIT